jgi:hypothetical protein
MISVYMYSTVKLRTLLLSLFLLACSNFSTAQEPVIEWEILPDLPRAAFGQLVTSCEKGIISVGGTCWEKGEKNGFQKFIC